MNYKHLKVIYRRPELETNKFLFLKIAIMNRENKTHIFKSTEQHG
tara:strand:+ start:2063 stop:2197 length:135 start_codon:yes stop_codon:yes gene_type:complete